MFYHAWPQLALLFDKCSLFGAYLVWCSAVVPTRYPLSSGPILPNAKQSVHGCCLVYFKPALGRDGGSSCECVESGRWGSQAELAFHVGLQFKL
jgi:hypothetical protein